MRRKAVGLGVGLLALAAILTVVVPAIGSPSGKSGGAVTAVKVVTDGALHTTTSTSFVNMPGASTSITVPAGQKALIIAHFSAESDCYDADVSSWCAVRIMIGGSQGSPAVGSNFAFDSIDSADTAGCSGDGCGWEGHSMDRTRGPVGPGTYTVRVQWAAVPTLFGPAPTFRLDDWSLIVERVKVG
jgi:hypothetical protein